MILDTPIISRRVTPSLSVRSIQVFLDGTQYAKGWYAVRRISVILYADINFYFKKVQFSSRNTAHVTNYIVSQITPKILRARFALVFGHFSIYKLKH